MEKWTEVPLCPGLSSYNQQPGANYTKTPTSPGGQSLLGPIRPCYQSQFGLNFTYKTMTMGKHNF